MKRSDGGTHLRSSASMLLLLFCVAGCRPSTSSSPEETAVTTGDTERDSSPFVPGESAPPQEDSAAPDSSPSDTDPGGISPVQYCEGENPELYACDPEENYDPWIASTGEINYWIRDAKTGAIPFLLTYESAVDYGYLQITSGEAVRDPDSEDVFHLWFSTAPNGPVLEGGRCEWYTARAQGNVYWSWNEAYADSLCILPRSPVILYVNFETRCYPDSYQGLCDDDNKQKSKETYQFDIARGLGWK